MAVGYDNQMLTEVFGRHADMLYRLCYSYMKNAADAEDMVQETFLRLLRAGKRFESLQHEKAWLIVTASNLCKDQLKSWWHSRRELDDQAPADLAREQDEDVVLAICSLPHDWKAAVYLYYYEGYDTRQISAMLKCPEGTVRSRLARARKRLNQMLGGNCHE